MEAITRKGLGGLCGPDSPEGDGDYQLHDSPRNDSSNQNENEYQARLQNMNALNAGNYDFFFKMKKKIWNLAKPLEFLQYILVFFFIPILILNSNKGSDSCIQINRAPRDSFYKVHIF